MASESQSWVRFKKQRLFSIVADISFSILFFCVIFYFSLILNFVGKSWNSIIWQFLVLFLISCATVCSIVFALQSVFDFLNNLSTIHSKVHKI